jgi:5-methyltetrahydrofolate--homocysteine methyltransferase
MNVDAREAFVAKHLEQAEQAQQRDAARPERVDRTGQVAASNVSRDVAIPSPPFWGNRVMGEEIDLMEVFDLLDLNTLFRLHWGGKNLHGEEYERHIESDFLPRLERMKREAIEQGYIVPGLVYGYYPAGSEGNDLVVLDPEDRSTEIARMPFPRQPGGDRLCLADYFAPLDSGRTDVVAFQVVTAGPVASEVVQQLNERGDYTEAYYVHGLSVSTAEALAEYIHQRIQVELGLPQSQGKRYSWGYPACPDLAQQERVLDILSARQEIGVTLTVAHLLVPEQSTAAMVVHHPEARYYSTLNRE